MLISSKPIAVQLETCYEVRIFDGGNFSSIKFLPPLFYIKKDTSQNV
jgi:hypothetical protein